MEARFTREAESDLVEIWAYVAREGSERAADRLIDTIQAACRRLATEPAMGRLRHFAGAKLHGLRSWPVGNYVVFYLVAEETVEIIRVIHGARDMDSIFST